MRKRRKETPMDKIKRRIEEAEEKLIHLKYNTGKKEEEDTNLDGLIIEVKDTQDIKSPIMDAQVKIKQMSSGPLDMTKKQEIDEIIKKIIQTRKK